LVIYSESEDFLSHLLPPYDGGRLRRELSRTFGMGVDIVDIPPHLNPPPPRGEEVIFFDSIGVPPRHGLFLKGIPRRLECILNNPEGFLVDKWERYDIYSYLSVYRPIRNLVKLPVHR